MNWKCKLGFHDWEQIACKSHSTIENEIKKEISKGRYYIVIERIFDTYYEDKICLRCGKRVYEIEEHKILVYTDLLIKKNRILKRDTLLSNPSTNI
jgi:hypothetical protein